MATERPLLSGPAIRRLLDSAESRPRRSLGQNFVTDPNTVRRIARIAEVGPGDRVVEIGAGLGSLTLALAHTGARVLAIETDRRLVPVLADVTGAVTCGPPSTSSADIGPGEVAVVEADARRIDWRSLLGDHEWHLVANLPYNIATSLVLDVLSDVPAVSRLLVMCQREAAERLAAEPGGSAYGAVSVRVAILAHAELAGAVPATVFHPRPEVESALVRITRRADVLAPVVRAEIDRLVGIAFSRRRQMLRRTLSPALAYAKPTECQSSGESSRLVSGQSSRQSSGSSSGLRSGLCSGQSSNVESPSGPDYGTGAGSQAGSDLGSGTGFGVRDSAARVFAAASIDPSDRPEQLGPEAWTRLAEASLRARDGQ